MARSSEVLIMCEFKNGSDIYELAKKGMDLSYGKCVC